jgi:hypothetical protein
MRKEERPVTTPDGDQRPVSAGSATASPSDTLFDDAAPQTSIHQAAFRSFDRFDQKRVVDPGLPGEPHHPSRLQYPHGGPGPSTEL